MTANPDPKDRRKRARKVRIELRRNRARTAREKSELTRRVHAEDEHVEDAEQGESVRAKGDLSRKRTIIVGGDEAAVSSQDGVAVAVRGLIVEVDDGRQLWACTVRRMLRTRMIDHRNPVAVGDRVRFQPVRAGGKDAVAVSATQSLPEGVIDKVEERHTTLTRHYERRVQIVAANVDLAVIVVAADQPTLRPHLIDRYLVAAHVGKLRPVICINKADLDQDGIAAGVAERYTTIGYTSLLTSVVTRLGLDQLCAVLRGQTSVLAGPSGAGKSSLLNALDPCLNLKVGTLSDLQRGRHTTTTARLLKWAFGGYVVDTPGLRQFDLAELEPDELEAYFKEFAELMPRCRFKNCTHTQETDCAVRAATESGQLAPERYESYCRMYEECVDKQREKYHS